MAGRTFAIGDIHGELDELTTLLSRLPVLDAEDTLVLLGDYVDRGPSSAAVVDFVRLELPKATLAKVVALRGNHEDAWLRVARQGWPEFLIPKGNGCLAALRSYTGDPHDKDDDPTPEERESMLGASFFPKDVLRWFASLPYFYEDRHAIYVHAGLIKEKDEWLHPAEVDDPTILLWVRTMDFFKNYCGKRVVVGHTSTRLLPPEYSRYTPEDPHDLWAGDCVTAIDTGCGKGGFLTAFELPAMRVYESKPQSRSQLRTP